MTSSKLTQLALIASGSAWMPAVSAHPGHTHEAGWLAGLLHSVTGWDQLLILFAVTAVGLYYLFSTGRH